MEKKLIERRIHEEKAHKIITRLAVETIDVSTLLNLVDYIEPYHYEEIVEERFLSKLCGYATCHQELVDIPAQKYKISTSQNKVFEIQDRKRYCSSHCYRSSKYFEAQISTVPIWLRGTDKDTEKRQPIKLLASGEKPKTGQEVKRGEMNEGVAVIANELSYASEIESELQKLEKNWRAKYKLDEVSNTPPSTTLKNNIFKRMVVDEKTQVQQVKAVNGTEQLGVNETPQPHKTHINCDEVHRRPTQLVTLCTILGAECVDRIADDVSARKLLLVIEYLVQRFSDLLTAKTRDYLMGSAVELNTQRMRDEYFAGCESEIALQGFLMNKLNLEAKPIVQHVNDHETEMCAKLRQMNMQVPGEDEHSTPDYAKLAEETHKQTLQIREFFAGGQLDDIDETSGGAYKQSIHFKMGEEDEFVRVLPTVDSHSQIEIRRRIFSEKLVKYMDQILKFSELTSTTWSTEFENHIKCFVYSLKLTSENIIFGTYEWPMVALIVLTCLTLKKGSCDEAKLTFAWLQDMLAEDKFIARLLSSFKLQMDQLRVICAHLVAQIQ